MRRKSDIRASAPPIRRIGKVANDRKYIHVKWNVIISWFLSVVFRYSTGGGLFAQRKEFYDFFPRAEWTTRVERVSLCNDCVGPITPFSLELLCKADL